MKLNKKTLGLFISVGIIEAIVVLVYQYHKKLTDGYHNIFIFKNKKMLYEDVFEGDTIATCCSNLCIDMNEAYFTEEQQSLVIYGFMSHITLVIPENIQVYLDTTESKLFLSSMAIIGNENLAQAPIKLKSNLKFSKVQVLRCEA